MDRLTDFDLVIVNSSGGKDSIVALWYIVQKAREESYPLNKIKVSHQDLGEAEWEGTSKLVKEQTDFFGLDLHITRRRDFKGKEETLLEYVLRRGKWPSNTQRWCTSDFKRGPGSRVVTKLTKGLGECKVLYVFGFRKDESPARSKKEKFILNKRLSTKKRTVYDYLPIHELSTKDIWNCIKLNNLPYHFASGLGMPRLSCVFCIFSPFDALVIAGKNNPKLLDKYIEVEKKIKHTFRNKFSIAEVKKAIEEGYKPKTVKDWVM